VYCALSTIDRVGKPCTEMYGSNQIGDGEPNKEYYLFDRIFSRSVTMGVGSTLLVRRSVLNKVGGFDTDLEYQYEDGLLSAKMAYFYPGFFLPQSLVQYRIHDSNASWDFMLTNSARKINYKIMLLTCRWLQKRTQEYQTNEFRIRLATLAFETHRKHCILSKDFYKLLMVLFPYRSANWNVIKTFLALILGYTFTNRVQRIMKYITG
jgi:GT2 family glycosyltransferase